VRQLRRRLGHMLRRIQAQQLVQPGLHLVAGSIPANRSIAWLKGMRGYSCSKIREETRLGGTHESNLQRSQATYLKPHQDIGSLRAQAPRYWNAAWQHSFTVHAYRMPEQAGQGAADAAVKAQESGQNRQAGGHT
jgi:hypothetical protein